MVDISCYKMDREDGLKSILLRNDGYLFYKNNYKNLAHYPKLGRQSQ